MWGPEAWGPGAREPVAPDGPAPASARPDALPDAPPERHEDEDLGGFRLIDGPVIVLFWVLAVVVFLQFFTRYVLNDSLAWTEEIARYLLIGTAFLGSVMAVRRESHIAVELVFRILPRGGRVVLQIAIDLVALAFFAFMAWLCADLAARTQQTMVSVRLPKSIVYWSVAGCFAGMALYGVTVLARHLRTRTSRLIDPAAAAPAGPGL